MTVSKMESNFRSVGICSVPPGWSAVYALHHNPGTDLDKLPTEYLVVFDPVIALGLAEEWRHAWDSDLPDQWSDNVNSYLVPITPMNIIPDFHEGEDSFLGFSPPGKEIGHWRDAAVSHIKTDWLAKERRLQGSASVGKE